MMDVRWSLITVTYNSASTLERFWQHTNLPDDVEWIVADNASSDASVGVARSLGARVARMRRNVGFGRANNTALTGAHGDYVCFVNPDVQIKVGDLSLLSTVLDREPRSLVAPQLMNEDGSLQPNGRGLPYFRNKIRHRLHPEYVSGEYLRFAGGSEEIEVAWLMGAVVAARRDWLIRLGPWDPRYFVYYEDHDLGLRNTAAGGTSRVVGSARWVHGWARETNALRVKPWLHELSSSIRFYSDYPQYLIRSVVRQGGTR